MKGATAAFRPWSDAVALAQRELEKGTRLTLGQGVPMLEELNEEEGPDLERLCQGVSPNDEPCGYPATVHCPSCKRWFCHAHAEDEDWHSCVREPGEEGGEA
jgi:hypothetical protein